MKSYTNFYETVKEANMRLQHTVILYDGHPYYVLCITDHKADGVFRMYLDPVREDGRHAYVTIGGMPYEWNEGPYTSPDGTVMYHKARGEKMDAWIEANPTSGVIRKMMNSPLFNKFRPYELGMLNTKWGAVFSQRSPVRHTQQGLTTSMISAYAVNLMDEAPSSRRGFQMDITSKYFIECVKGIYPDFDESLAALKNKELDVKSAAFHRNFALIKGPVSSVFLAYKEDVIGIIPGGKKDQVLLGTEYQHCKEVVENLGIFGSVQ